MSQPVGRHILPNVHISRRTGQHEQDIKEKYPQGHFAQAQFHFDATRLQGAVQDRVRCFHFRMSVFKLIILFPQAKVRRMPHVLG